MSTNFFETLNSAAIELGLEEITALMKRLKNPERDLKIIHIAGTNGKGSVSQMISSILRAGGYKVGTFNSPHLIFPTESIQINGQEISQTVFEQYGEVLKQEVEVLKKQNLEPSYFEVLVATALLYFKRQQVDFVILEVGLGGRLDATNVINQSILSVITKISIDHTDYLGKTLEEITSQKAGIIKKSGYVITPSQAPEILNIIRQVCNQQEAQLDIVEMNRLEKVNISEEGTNFAFEGHSYSLKLIGEHQAYNASLAIKCIEQLAKRGYIKLLDKHYTSESLYEVIKKGLYETRWPGRFEKIKENPSLFIDGAHNADGIQALVNTVHQLDKQYTIGIIGVLRDKEVDQMLQQVLPVLDSVIVTEPYNPRKLEAEVLLEKVQAYGKEAIAEKEIDQALERALELAKSREQKERGNVRIIALGSLYMIGKIRNIILD